MRNTTFSQFPVGRNWTLTNVLCKGKLQLRALANSNESAHQRVGFLRRRKHLSGSRAPQARAKKILSIVGLRWHTSTVLCWFTESIRSSKAPPDRRSDIRPGEIKVWLLHTYKMEIVFRERQRHERRKFLGSYVWKCALSPICLPFYWELYL